VKQIRKLLEIVGKWTEIVRWGAVVEKVARQTPTVLHFNWRNVNVAALLDFMEGRCLILAHIYSIHQRVVACQQYLIPLLFSSSDVTMAAFDLCLVYIG
jgi:putative SOS response-associated peptidase YedK